MTEIELNPLIGGTSSKDETNILSAAQTCEARTSGEKQTPEQERFRQAGEYARQAAVIVPFYAEMERRTMKSAYSIAFSDWLHAPEVHGVQRRPGCIDIQADDNVHLQKVYVTITNEDGVTLEQGQAVPLTARLWIYETEVPGRVLVEAFDLAGNVTRYEAGQER